MAQALPQLLHAGGGPLDALGELPLGIQEMAGDAQRRVSFTRLIQQIEQVQGTQRLSGQRGVQQTFDGTHGEQA